MTSTYGHFEPDGAYVIDRPLTPRPWINYLSNRRLRAFISQNAGGPVWYRDPAQRRVSRYHYLPVPEDQPGMYVYVHDGSTGRVWNPHFGPTQTDLDAFNRINPCGLTAETMTSLSKLTGKDVSLDEFSKVLLEKYAKIFETNFTPVTLDELAEDIESQSGGNEV